MKIKLLFAMLVMTKGKGSLSCGEMGRRQSETSGWLLVAGDDLRTRINDLRF